MLSLIVIESEIEKIGLNLENIAYIEANESDTIVYTLEGELFKIKMPFQKFLNEIKDMPDVFFKRVRT